MGRVRSPNRDKAFEIYKEHDGKIANREIANILGVSEKTISGWKVKDKWNYKLNGVLQKKIRSTPNKRGGQPNNKNAVGNTGGGPPKENKNAETHGFFSKYLPEDTFNIIQEIEVKNPIDILWENIKIQYAAIIRAQKIMYVKSQQDHTKELVKETIGEKADTNEWEIQYSWDKQANFLNAQSRAMKTLEGMIKQYDELLNKNWTLVTEEQKTRIEVLKSKVNKDNNTKEDKLDKYFDMLEGAFKND